MYRDPACISLILNLLSVKKRMPYMQRLLGLSSCACVILDLT